MKLEILLLFALIVYGVDCQQQHKLTGLQSPPFLENKITLNKAIAAKLFRGKLVAYFNALPRRPYCKFVLGLSGKIGLKTSRTKILINRFRGNSRTLRLMKTKKRNCNKLLQIKNGIRKSETKKSERMNVIGTELLSLYNNLPLPFQCEILFETGRLSASTKFDISENSIGLVTKLNLYEVGNIIQQLEKVLSSDLRLSIVKVAKQCVKVLAGRKYRTTDIIAVADIGDRSFLKWRTEFLSKMKWIMGKFALDNGIKIDNLHNLTVKDNLPYSAYFTHILNVTKVGRKHEVKFHMHLLKADSRALEARYTLNALDALSYNDVKSIFGVEDFRYWAIEHQIKTTSTAENTKIHKMLFPGYLRWFFNNSLEKHERCLILHFITRYSNSSMDSIIKFLTEKNVDVKFPCSVVNGVMSVVLSPKRNRENEVIKRKTDVLSAKTTPRTVELHPFWNVGSKDGSRLRTGPVGVQKRIINYRKATMVEIVMFVVFGALAIVLTVFFITCVLFIVRKRRLRKENLDTRQREDVLAHEDRTLNADANQGSRLVNLELEPLRFSTDDEDGKCDEDSSVCLSTVTHSSEGAASFYRGGRRFVPAVRYSKSLARKLAQSDRGKMLEKVPEKCCLSLEGKDSCSEESFDGKKGKCRGRQPEKPNKINTSVSDDCGSEHGSNSDTKCRVQNANSLKSCDTISIKALLHYSRTESKENGVFSGNIPSPVSPSRDLTECRIGSDRVEPPVRTYDDEKFLEDEKITEKLISSLKEANEVDRSFWKDDITIRYEEDSLLKHDNNINYDDKGTFLKDDIAIHYEANNSSKDEIAVRCVEDSLLKHDNNINYDDKGTFLKDDIAIHHEANNSSKDDIAIRQIEENGIEIDCSSNETSIIQKTIPPQRVIARKENIPEENLNLTSNSTKFTTL